MINLLILFILHPMRFTMNNNLSVFRLSVNQIIQHYSPPNRHPSYFHNIISKFQQRLVPNSFMDSLKDLPMDLD